MPKFFYEEGTLREWASEMEDMDEPPGVPIDIEAEIAAFKREDDGRLSEYRAASCALDEEKLNDCARVALAELRRIGATQLHFVYNGGGDEGFAEFQKAVTAGGDFDLLELAERLQDGPLGDTPPPNPNPRYHAAPAELTRDEQARVVLEWSLPSALATQLLGRGFGTGEYSLEGRFVADLTNNTLTDIPPVEGA